MYSSISQIYYFFIKNNIHSVFFSPQVEKKQNNGIGNKKMGALNRSPTYREWIKSKVQGLQRLQNRSLLNVNENFEDKRNEEFYFLATPYFQLTNTQSKYSSKIAFASSSCCGVFSFTPLSLYSIPRGSYLCAPNVW